MMKRIKILAAWAVAALTVQAADGIRVHTIGDSTMADYDENATVTRGWGMYLQQFLDGVTVNNRGKGGADTRGFFEGEALCPGCLYGCRHAGYVARERTQHHPPYGLRRHNDGSQGGQIV